MAEIKLKVPVTPDGKFDLKAQQDIFSRYKQTASIQKNIQEQLHLLHSINVDLD